MVDIPEVSLSCSWNFDDQVRCCSELGASANREPLGSPGYIRIIGGP